MVRYRIVVGFDVRPNYLAAVREALERPTGTRHEFHALIYNQTHVKYSAPSQSQRVFSPFFGQQKMRSAAAIKKFKTPSAVCNQ